MKAFYNSFGLETLVIIDGELIQLITHNLEEIKCLFADIKTILFLSDSFQDFSPTE
jgi:hypothetical protein